MAVLATTGTLALPPEKDRWHQRLTEHFTFLGNADEKTTASVATSFETVRAAVGALVPGVPLRSPAPMDVYVFRDVAALRPYARVRETMDPTHVAGYFRSAEYVDLCAIVGTADPAEYQEAIRAYIADLVGTTYPGAPAWLADGLAQVYASFTVAGGKIEVGRPIGEHVLLLRARPAIPIRELLTMRAPEPGPVLGGPSVFQAQSWALVHLMLIGDASWRPKIVTWLGSIAKGVPASAAFEQTLGPDVAALDDALKAYVAQKSFSFLAIPAEALSLRPAGDPSPLGRRDLLYRLGWLLANIDPVNAAQAEAHFLAALAIDPEHAPSLTGLAWLKARDRSYDDAAKRYDEAIRKDPIDPLVRLLAATNLLAQATAARGDSDAPAVLPEGVVRARALLLESLERDPRSAEARVALGATYVYDPGDVAPGIAALETASASLPPRADLLLNLLSLTIRAGDRARARAIVDGPIQELGDPATLARAREKLGLADLPEINARLAANDLNGALALLEQALTAAPTEKVRARLESEIARVKPVALRNRQIVRYNEAADLARKGDWKGAAALLDTLLAESPEGEVRTLAEDLLRRARAAAPARKK